MISEKELHNIWKKYIDKNIYRVSSAEYLKDIKKNGFDPNKDPFTRKEKDKIKMFFKIILRLHGKKVVYKEKIGRNGEFTIYGPYITKRSIISMNSRFIDLTTDYNQALRFKRLFRGGALTMAVHNFCKFLEDKRDMLTKKEVILLDEMVAWTKKKRSHPTKLIFIRGLHQCLEKAKFHYQLKIKKNQKYYPSPYGSFENFIKIARSKGIRKYLPYLRHEKYFYLRTTHKIPASAITKII